MQNFKNDSPVEINHIRFYFSQIDLLKKVMTNEQMGRLFFAVANYAMTGVKSDVDADILYPYEDCCFKVDKQKGKY